jgi:cytochrome bd ubiquinol oxidase subunit II
MSGAAHYVPLLWAGVAAAAILAYVLMDGWVLGVGILYPLVARQTDRDLLIASIAPSWAANDTWLVFGALLLMLGFPTAYSLLLTELYLPIFAMLLVLVVRAVSYGFRRRGNALRRIWELAFAGGSILAALAQGYIVGRLIEGFGGNVVTSGFIGWLRALFPALCSLGLLGCYGLLGACWLIFKADGALRVMGREVSHSALLLTMTVIVAACLLTPVVSPYVAHRWLDPEMRVVLGLLAATAGVIIWQLWASLWRSEEQRPLQWALVFVTLAFAGIVISLYPYIVPYRFTVYELANDPAFMKFAGVLLCVVLPVVVLYLLIGYRTLRGKTGRAAIPVQASSALASCKTCGNNVDLHLS